MSFHLSAALFLSTILFAPLVTLKHVGTPEKFLKRGIRSFIDNDQLFKASVIFNTYFNPSDDESEHHKERIETQLPPEEDDYGVGIGEYTDNQDKPLPNNPIPNSQGNLGSENIPENPGGENKPDKPGSENLPEKPGSENIPDKPGSGNIPEKPGSGNKPDKPGSGNIPEKPGSGNIPEKPGSENIPEKPGSENVPEESNSMYKVGIYHDNRKK